MNAAFLRLKNGWIITCCLAVIFLSGCTATASGPLAYTLPPGDTLHGDLRVFGGTATLAEASNLTGSVYMTNGSLRLAPGAQIQEDIVMVSGKLRLQPEAVVYGDIILFSGNISIAPGAVIFGELTSSPTRFIREVIARLLQQILLFCCLPCLILAGVVGAILIWRRRKFSPSAQRVPTIQIVTESVPPVEKQP